MEPQFHNENVHIMTAAQDFSFSHCHNLLNEKKRVNEMARHITCTLSMGWFPKRVCVVKVCVERVQRVCA